MSACSNDVKNPESNPTIPDEMTRSYLNVALYAPFSSTRASDYIDGMPSENQVNTVRFFFFKANGEACMVFKQAASGSYLSYIDWTPYDSEISDPEDSNTTVEKIATATLGLNQPVDEGLPELILAVVNPTSDILALTNPALNEIKSLANDYFTDLHDNNFLITNSVYIDKTGAEIIATPISNDNFGDPSIEGSVENMQTLNIFVERVLARLDFSLMLNEETNPSITLNDESIIYQVSQPTLNGDQDSQVYVRLLGWNLTATSDFSRAVKMVNPSWNEEIFGGVNNSWYNSQYHRSFWAINPQNLTYSYGDFTDAQTQSLPTSSPVTVYLQENAADYTSSLSAEGPETPTSLIIGAQLVNSTGEPLLLARWANRYYIQENLLEAVASVLNLFQQTTENGVTTFTQITSDYLQFVSPSNVTLPTGETAASYYTYVQLNDDGLDIEWYNGESLGATLLSSEAVNSYILNRVNYVLVWTKGYTYYYFDIRHLGTENNSGYYGIVRNHLYQANLSSISGVGTPVFEPGKVIYPTKPDPDDNILDIQVNILQWRIVKENYEITWP